ncbi:MAG: hypothetical protein MH825_00930 [Cyanobacteria bacterium]|nr:hypothetical protein [Cyanobacteriota bacterium]
MPLPAIAPAPKTDRDRTSPATAIAAAQDQPPPQAALKAPKARLQTAMLKSDLTGQNVRVV